MNSHQHFWRQHRSRSRRFFLSCGAAGAAAWALHGPSLETMAAPDSPSSREDLLQAPELRKPLAELEPWLTRQDDFRDVSRGAPKPHTLPPEKLAEVGLTRDTWQLEVVSDPDQPALLGRELTRQNGAAVTFAQLLELAKTQAVRFPKVMTCLNIGCPLGMGIWEGVPLRDVVWMAEPAENLRRVFYYGYHNDDPAQMFRSSLPIGRVLEDTFDLPPVILCYKLNGHWLTSERGGPVRIVVPEAYGFKSIKWLTRVVLSNLFYANDTYGEKNNDVDSPLKTFAATLTAPRKLPAQSPLPVTGYAQVGVSGLSKVQVWLHPNAQALSKNDPYFLQAPWQDATLLQAPSAWGGDLPEDRIPAGTKDFDAAGQPDRWPLRLAKAHWAALLPGVPAGEYTLRCRSVDAQGNPQPMPRPFRKSGHAAIERIKIVVEAE